MIIKITKDNTYILKDTFIDIKYINDEFKSNPYAEILILKEKDEIIGYIYYSIIYDRVEINQFEINFIHRNCGKGGLLLQELIKSVEKDITLEVKKDNYQAIHLYEKNGFRKIAIRKSYYKDTDGILMERKYKKDSH